MPSLLLFPGDPCWVPGDRAAFISSLTELGLISGGEGSADTAGFRPGPEYLSLIMFLGCSPRVSFDPLHDDSGQPVGLLHCRIYPEVQFVSAAPGPKVRCARCRAPAGEVDVTVHDRVYTCPRCGATAAVSALDWRQAAGFGRCFVDVEGIHPHEAVPSDKLLDSLRECSGNDWAYCYL
jgi:hypothetical protein